MKKIIVTAFCAILSAMAASTASAQAPAGSQVATGQQVTSGMAVVEFSANMMREEPDYAAELGDQALMGTIVEVLGREGTWVKVKSPEPYTAWVTDMGLVEMSPKQIEDYLEAPKYICTVPVSHVYEEPSLKSGIVSELLLGDIVRILYKTITHTRGSLKGYDEGRAVLTKKFVGVVLPSGKTGYVPAKDVDVFYRWAKEKKARSGETDSFGEDVIRTSCLFLGVPYMWGGTSIKNVDCSGLVRSAYFANGVLLPRNASQQARVGEGVDIFSASGEVDWKDLKAGDLVFWGREATEDAPAKATHVGLYIGDGKFIHSAQIVRISSLDKDDPDFYDRRPILARRIIGHVDEEGKGIISTFRSPHYFPVQ
ncbi:MAG: C40 family peptidase [Bacteroidales bacterium]|nr:C40 family peptidase [Bacteroidales bacterium]